MSKSRTVISLVAIALVLVLFYMFMVTKSSSNKLKDMCEAQYGAGMCVQHDGYYVQRGQ